MTDHLVPLPPALQPHVELRGPANRSLVFDRGFDRFERRGETGCRFIKADPQANRRDGKTSFLQRFCSPGTFSAPGDFAPLMSRRKKALELVGARPVARISQTRLVIGLGLPHPTKTALLLDRLTGCPYIPGSSLKGVLRNTAQLIEQGKLETEDDPPLRFSEKELRRLFGPPADSEIRAKGELVFYDAFPDSWPTLEVDILTPHYQPYYSEDAANPTIPPGDWYDPNPVAFPTIAPGTTFTFWIGHRSEPANGAGLDRIESLLGAAVGRFGLGGKTSAGYGIFGTVAPALPRAVTPPEFEPLSEPPAPLGSDEVLWTGAELFLDRTRPTVRNSAGEVARGFGAEVPEAARARLERGAFLDADVVVKQSATGRWTLVSIRSWKE